MSTREKNKAKVRKAARLSGPTVARLNGISMSARKAQPIASLVRGKMLSEAFLTLSFQNKKSALILRKVLDSAASIADGKGHDIDKLFISRIEVNKGPIMKRFMPRAQGRATRIRKQTSHVIVEVDTVKAD